MRAYSCEVTVDTIHILCRLCKQGYLYDVRLCDGNSRNTVRQYNLDDIRNFVVSKPNASLQILSKCSSTPVSIRLDNVNGYKLNAKSITILTRTYLGVGARAGYRINIRFCK